MKVGTRLFLVLFMALFIPSATGCGQSVFTEDFYQSYQVRSGTVIDIYNPNGSVTLKGSDESNVEISATITAHSQAALDDVEIYIDIADKMSIKTEHPGDKAVVSVDYELKVPSDILVGKVECSSGDIVLEKISGNPQVITSNGSVSAAEINGIVTAVTSNGNISVTGVRSIAGLETSNGSITAELPLIHDSLDISTSNGSIDLFLDPGLAVDLRAMTSNGQVVYNDLDLEIIDHERTMLSGSMNGGGVAVNLSTSNGSIELARLR